MPCVNIARAKLCAAIGLDFSKADFEKLCFEFGIELDDEMFEPNDAGVLEAVWKVEIPANRYDLLCVEGLARAIRVFLRLEETPVFATSTPAALLEMHVQPETGAIRPFVVCAVLRGMTFTPDNYQSFIDLQDKLHHNICRRRTLVAIGTHDLSTLTPPFSYQARVPSAIEFVPLSQARSFKSDELLEFYRTDASVKHIKPFTDIIYSSPVYPVIYDAAGVVLSLPPIINGEHSKIVAGKTKDVFIECTATDLTKANVVLNTMVTMFAQYCSSPFVVEPVKVVYPDGSVQITPDLSTRSMSARVDEIQSVIGVPLEPSVMVDCANRMQLKARGSARGDIITVDVPPMRSDVLHECDVVEDVAIAFGFNNIPRRLPKTQTVGKQLPINAFSDLLRYEVAAAGFDEVLTLALCSIEENFEFLHHAYKLGDAVVLANPQSEEFQICRTLLLPGLLKTLYGNRSTKISGGLKLFEISDVVVVDASADVGARNQRHLSAVFMSHTSGFEVIHGLVDRLMRLCEVRPSIDLEVDAGWDTPAPEGVDVPRYRLEPCADPMYLSGRSANLIVGSERIGHFGILHPDVLANFKLLSYPVSSVEINLEKLL